MATIKQRFADIQTLYEQHKNEFKSSDEMCEQLWHSCILAADCDSYAEYILKCAVQNIADVLVLKKHEFADFAERRRLWNVLRGVNRYSDT